MGDVFKKVKNGEKLKIPASTYNAMIDAAQDYVNRKNNLDASGNNVLGANMVFVKNTSNQHLNRYGVLAISGNELASQTAKDVICFTGVAPTGTNATGGRFVITADPIAQGKIGRAWISGCVPVQLSVNNEAHLYADIIGNDCTKLQTNDYGPAVILWKESGTGVKSGFVRFGGEPAAGFDIRRARLTQDAGTGTTIGANLFHKTLGYVQTFGAEAGVTVNCRIHGGTDLNSALPYLKNGMEIMVVKLPHNTGTQLDPGVVSWQWHCTADFWHVVFCE